MDLDALQARRGALQRELADYVRTTDANIHRLQGALAILDDLIAREEGGHVVAEGEAQEVQAREEDCATARDAVAVAVPGVRRRMAHDRNGRDE